MAATEPLIELRARLGEQADLDAVGRLLRWDQNVLMPPAGEAARARHRATVRRLGHALLVDERVGELLDAVAPRAEGIDADLVRYARREREKALRIPGELLVELTRAVAVGHEAWLRARAAGEFAVFLPHLERILALRRDYAACFPEAEHPYDALLDDYEPGMRASDVRAIFDRLTPGLTALLDRVRGSGVVLDRSPLHRAFPVEGQRRLVDEVLRALGSDARSWRVDETVHPFATVLAPGDVRLTTRYIASEEEGLHSLLAALHEFGHCLYDASVDPALDGTPLGAGVSLTVHESQSRLWENFVGRDTPFWRWALPLARRALPGQLDGVELDAMQCALGAVVPLPIRILSDEVTYNLHIVIRFELELALVEGTLAPADLPAAWNERYRELLGIEVADDIEGVLQDIHWSEGSFGYFPTYALGNVLAGQLWARIRTELPDLDERIAAGDFAPLRAWLAEHVHRHGRRLTPAQTIEQAAGGPLDPQPLLDYLEAKVGPLYGI